MSHGKILFIDTSLSGLSGDMLLSAFLDMGFTEETLYNIFSIINKNYPSPFFKEFKTVSIKREGIAAKMLITKILDNTNLLQTDDFKEILSKSLENINLKDVYRDYALKVAETLISSEKTVHKSDTENTHLHELSSPDTLFDILGVSAALQYFSILEEADIYATPLPVGGGTVKFSHGVLNVPAPAVLEILREYAIPFHFGPVKEEILTPTGAALLANLNPVFKEIPVNMVVESKGYGAGNRAINNFPNILRLIIASRADLKAAGPLETDFAIVLETNLDDVSGEQIGYAIEKLMKAGALDVSVTPAFMKKGRLGYIVKVICPVKAEGEMVSAMFNYTNTLGVRRSVSLRYKLRREIETVKVKIKGETFTV
ncbi:MAG: nickel pincer cofactor biosynthesis protein LarC, partial [Candidatus Odinarchaeota archaeon]